MKLKITSKGKVGSTRVVDADTGEVLQNVVAINWSAKGGAELPTATIVVLNVPVSIEVDKPKIVKTQPETTVPAVPVPDSASAGASK